MPIIYPDFLFIFLFLFKYLRLIVHSFSVGLYKPAPVSAHPTFDRSDCTVILPTVEPTNVYFKRCLRSVLANNPRALLIVTVGKENFRHAEEVVAPFRKSHPKVTIQVTKAPKANKRTQIVAALPEVHTEITVLVDDHVSWPSTNFLPAILAPFEDDGVGIVGVNNSGRRLHNGFSFAGFWNMVGNLYLERHNWDSKATLAIDGGLYVVAGRTSASRSSILKDPKFSAEFVNERFFFGLFGPLNADDDNFVTRWAMKHGWKIWYQESEDARIETTIGDYPKFLSQCLRWARTTWRSNAAALFTDRTVYRKHPWCTYAVYLVSFFNFALAYDAGLIYLLGKTSFHSQASVNALLLWVCLAKLVKVRSYFYKYPSDLVYAPAYIAFIYYHCFIKLWAGLTFWETSWGSRPLHTYGDDIDAREPKQSYPVTNKLGSMKPKSSILHTKTEVKKRVTIPQHPKLGGDMDIEETQGYEEDMELSQGPNGTQVVLPNASGTKRWFWEKQGRMGMLATGVGEATMQVTSKVEKQVRMGGLVRSKTD
ncbi:hypothetical protein EJ08DRAFT_584889 [Tothia fuscella]|uniref:Uncharacterized protein n=1 Tax=Tothia fuscella TaxID=1048955 RepID=A0A9P4U0T2_9PEZI|nr:hypothetical protein EJ08DRAFT_584889 [Tothia fuscella]